MVRANYLNEVTEKAPLGVLILLLCYSFRLFTRCKRPYCVARASLSHPTETFSVTSNEEWVPALFMI